MRRGSNDPLVVLRSAAADGLLTYRGFDTEIGFEVTIAGRDLVVPRSLAIDTVRFLRTIQDLQRAGTTIALSAVQADGMYVLDLGPALSLRVRAEIALDTVRRLRTIREMQRAGDSVELRGMDDDGTLVLELGAVTVRVAGGDFTDWLRGHRAASAAVGQEHTGPDRIGKIQALFEDPSRDDQCRMVLLGQMYGGAKTVSNEELRQRIGKLPGVRKMPTKKTVVDSLGFGAFMSSKLAEQLIRAFGLRWIVTAGTGRGGALAGPGAAGVEVLPEMPALVRLRMIVAASRAGWLRYADLPSPNRARWRPTYDLVVGEQTHTVSVVSLRAWLAGLAAFHGVAEPPGEHWL